MYEDDSQRYAEQLEKVRSLRKRLAIVTLSLMLAIVAGIGASIYYILNKQDGGELKTFSVPPDYSYQSKGISANLPYNWVSGESELPAQPEVTLTAGDGQFIDFVGKSETSSIVYDIAWTYDTDSSGNVRIESSPTERNCTEPLCNKDDDIARIIIAPSSSNGFYIIYTEEQALSLIDPQEVEDLVERFDIPN